VWEYGRRRWKMKKKLQWPYLGGRSDMEKGGVFFYDKDKLWAMNMSGEKGEELSPDGNESLDNERSNLEGKWGDMEEKEEKKTKWKSTV
jgi:hypothetical protein